MLLERSVVVTSVVVDVSVVVVGVVVVDVVVVDVVVVARVVDVTGTKINKNFATQTASPLTSGTRYIIQYCREFIVVITASFTITFAYLQNNSGSYGRHGRECHSRRRICRQELSVEKTVGDSKIRE